MTAARLTCSIVSPYLLRALARRGEQDVAEAARRTLQLDVQVRQLREVRTERARPTDVQFPGPTLLAGPVTEPVTRPATRRPARAPAVKRSIHDAGHPTSLPGALVRAEGAGPRAGPGRQPGLRRSGTDLGAVLNGIPT